MGSFPAILQISYQNEISSSYKHAGNYTKLLTKLDDSEFSW